MKTIMIPARLSSRRIPRKNLRNFCGGSLVEIAITKAQDSKLFDEIYVNSPDKDILDLAREVGAIPYKRDKSLDAETVTNSEFVSDFFTRTGVSDLYMLNTTSPLLSVSTIHKFVEAVENSDSDTMMSVVTERAPIIMRGDPCNFNYSQHTPSELLPPYSKIVWALTHWNKDKFLSLKCGTYSGKVEFFEMPKIESIDLDTEQDWVIAEVIYDKLYGKFRRWTGFFAELGGE